MLDQQTKRRIDAARDILVGKVPDPKAQVEQITTALIYKFMDDMDKESEELGGEASFFVDGYQQYAWSKLLNPRLGGFDRLSLYVEALTKMPQNPHLPQLFRDIFKDAILPYRDPETLNLFLKEINGFTYDHSENLGNAFEYLLSVMDSQGDAGQFRTPRHIIDFIVKVVDPTKEDTILDPACGTAGFLISSYKHILQQNSLKRLGDQLTPDERTRLMRHFVGYDISPEMVRLSLVNMYLHGFPNPNIHEYDTLTSEERWDELYDVIMANPPFMSPKGGIRPHKRFSIQANRSEVLFVDYIAEHLAIHGRAGVIVPEGIIFQSGTAYKALRKMLVEKYVWAVVSLPSGIFQPYSGVKTSILLMDTTLAKKADSILFVKVENDGFDLGAQRRPIDKSDLPQALVVLQQYKQALQNGEDPGAILSDTQVSKMAVIAEKSKIAKNGDYNLSGERYKEAKLYVDQKWPMVELGDVCDTTSGGTPLKSKNEYYENGTIPWLKSGAVAQGYIYQSEEKITEAGLRNSSAKIFPVNTVLVAMYGATAGQVGLLKFEAATNQAICGILPNNKFVPEFLYWLLKSQRKYLVALSGGGAQPNISQNIIRKLQIPLPPLEVQQEIVVELESYQKIIDGAKQVVANYKPIIKIDPNWLVVTLGDLFETKSGTTPSTTKSEYYENGKIHWVKTKDLNNSYIYDTEEKITELALKETHCEILPINTVLIAMYGGFNQIGRTGILKIPATTNQALTALLPNPGVNSDFLNLMLISFRDKWRLVANSTRKDPNISRKDILGFEIPLPPLEVQQQIACQIEEEQKRVQATKELIEIFEQKIRDKIAEAWGELKVSEAEVNMPTQFGTLTQAQLL